jgi:hypothetical protein
MKQKNNLKQRLKRFFATKGSDSQKISITPYRDWRIIVIVFFIGIVVSLGLNVYLFMGVNEDNFFGTTVKREEILKFDKEKLSVVVESFTKKEAAFETLKKSVILLIDPSL